VAGPTVRIHLPPAESQQRTVPAVGFDGARPRFTLPIGTRNAHPARPLDDSELAAKFIDCAKREMPADVAGSRLAIGAYRTHRADRIVAEGKDERQ
jgi:hypothetical protein